MRILQIAVVKQQLKPHKVQNTSFQFTYCLALTKALKFLLALSAYHKPAGLVFVRIAEG